MLLLTSLSMYPNVQHFNVDMSRGSDPKSPHTPPHVIPHYRPWLRWFTRGRWSLLFPLYRRLDIAGLRDFAVIELMVIFAYVSINFALVLAALVKIGREGSGDPLAIQSTANDIGRYANSNVLLLLLPIARNSVWQYIFGISFDRGVFFHKWIARVAVAEVLTHGGCQLAAAWYEGQFHDVFLRDGVHGPYTSGPIAAFAAVALVLTSLHPIRRLIWKAFFAIHLMLFVTFIVFAFLHATSNRNTIAFGIALYGLDRLLRIVSWSRRATMTSIRALPGDIISITFDKPDFHYQSGQFVLVCIPIISPFEWHPFSLSSSPHQPSVTVHCKATGGWTRRLHKLAVGQSNPTSPASMPLMLVEGPYGSLSLPLERYDNFLFVAGGVGVTPLGSVYNDLVYQHYAGERVLRHVRFVWSVRTAQAITSVYPDVNTEGCPKLPDLEAQAPTAVPPTHYMGTAALTAHDRLIKTTVGQGDSLPSIPALTPRCIASFHITGTQASPAVDSCHEDWITRGRPKLEEQVSAMVATVEAQSAADGGQVKRCAVLLCGPPELVREARLHCVRQSRGAVRFDIHEETFEW